MTKLIVNADDFGYSKGVNYGIAEAHLNGVVTSATMMANMPGLSHALKLMRELPALGVGIHLSLTLGKPVSPHVDLLTGEEGLFKTQAHYQTHTADLNQLYEEWKAQITKLLHLGVPLTHIDSHHHMHTLGGHVEVAERLSEEFQLPLRTYFGADRRSRHEEYFPAEVFWNLFHDPLMKDMSRPYPEIKDEVLAVLEKGAGKHASYALVEAGCHPGYVDTILYYQSSFHLPRMREVEVLTSPEFMSTLSVYGYELCHYGEWSGT